MALHAARRCAERRGAPAAVASTANTHDDTSNSAPVDRSSRAFESARSAYPPRCRQRATVVRCCARGLHVRAVRQPGEIGLALDRAPASPARIEADRDAHVARGRSMAAIGHDAAPAARLGGHPHDLERHVGRADVTRAACVSAASWDSADVAETFGSRRAVGTPRDRGRQPRSAPAEEDSTRPRPRRAPRARRRRLSDLDSCGHHQQRDSDRRRQRGGRSAGRRRRRRRKRRQQLPQRSVGEHGQARVRCPKIAVPTRTSVAPSSTATSKSWLMPMESSRQHRAIHAAASGAGPEPRSAP